MLKGISRQTVEISDADDPYFERIFLVVRADCADLPPDRLDQEAKRLLRRCTPYSGIRRARRWQRARRWLAAAVGVAVGVLITLMLTAI